MFAFFESPAHESYIVLCKHKENTEMAHTCPIFRTVIYYTFTMYLVWSSDVR